MWSGHSCPLPLTLVHRKKDPKGQDSGKAIREGRTGKGDSWKGTSSALQLSPSKSAAPGGFSDPLNLSSRPKQIIAKRCSPKWRDLLLAPHQKLRCTRTTA
jgi:hypothetical protein